MSIVFDGFLKEFFKKKRWILEIAVISIVVYFLALTFVGVVKMGLSVNTIDDYASLKRRNSYSRNIDSRKSLSFSYFKPIISRDLFDVKLQQAKPVSTKPKRVVVENIPISQRLGLRLVGTIVGSPDTLSRAIVYNTRTGKYVLLKIKDKINGAELEEVVRDQIILSVNGKKERLISQTEQLPTNFKNRIKKVRSVRQTNSIVKSKSGDSIYTLSRDEINKAFNDLPSLLSGATAVPYSRNGVSGFILRDVKSGSIYSKVGLKRGDIIVSVNGQPLKNTSQLMQLYNDVRNQSEIQMNIIRNNSKKILTYYLE